MKIIDMHTHVIPPGIIAETRSAGGVFGVHERSGEMVHPEGFRAPLTPDFYDPEAILSRMDHKRIDGSIVSLSPTMFFYDEDPAEAVEFSMLANDAMAELVQGVPRLLGLAHLPLQDPDSAARELQRSVNQGGLRGALIGTNVDDKALDDAGLDPLFGAASELGVPLILHPYFVGPKPRLEPYFMTNTIGNPLDTCIAAARLIHTGVLDRWPELKIVLVHGAGYLPYQLGRLDHAYEVRPENKASLPSPPSSYIRRFWSDTLTHSDDSLRFLRDQIGVDRLLIGTDLPYDMADADPVDRLERIGQDPAVLGANAAMLFGEF